MIEQAIWHHQGSYLSNDRLVYIAESVLGRGTFADVHLARYQVPGEPAVEVALKIFRGGRLDLEQVNDEIKIAQRLSHPNLVKVFGLCELPSRGALSLVMELAEGGSMHNVLLDRDRYPELLWHVRVRWLREVSQGMQALQTMLPGTPIIHRFLWA